MDKMKLKKISIYFLFGTFGVGGVAIHSIWTLLFRFTAYTIEIDQSFSPVVQANIRDFIQNTPSFTTASLTTLNQQIKKKFPCIEYVTAERYAPGIAHIQIKTAKPLVYINDSMIVAQDGSYVSKDLFTAAALKKTIALTCTELSTNTTISPALAQSVRFFLNPLVQQYAITWHNDHTTVLGNKQEPWFTIICNTTPIPSDALLIQCEQIKQKLITTKSNNNWIADIRFHNQIVVYNKKKGATYG